MQHSLFDLPHSLQSRVITRRSDFEPLFEGYETMRAISYVASAELLLEVFEKPGFKSVELILGDSFGPLSREALAAEGVDVVERLAQLVEAGRLQVYLPRTTIHTKLYLLGGASGTRVIQTSANLTLTARKATKQTNYAWVVDLPDGDPWLAHVVRDYDAHKKGCSLFLDSLLKLFRDSADTPQRQVIEAWLTGAASSATDSSGSTKLLGEITEWALDPARIGAQPVYAVTLPEIPSARRQVEKLLGRFGATLTSNSAHLDHRTFLTHIDQVHRLPIMRVDTDRKEVRLGIGGELILLSEPPPEAKVIDDALAHLERYLQTVDWGKAVDERLAKMAMFEATLYMLAAPFANEQMKVMRQRYGSLERRGPKILYLLGQSSNGKTTFLRFALLLLTGKDVRPLSADDFTKTRIQSSIALGTSFPLVFDDVNPAQRHGFEDILKAYWEEWWRPEGVSPQIVIASNNPSLKEWAKSRVKRIDFDVHFAPSEKNRARLGELFQKPNPIFRWFSKLYVENLARLAEPHDDELHFAREIMRQLYDLSGRELPAFFPRRPLEEVYDPGRIKWLDMIHRSKQATPRRDRERVIVEFSPDLQYFEVKQHRALLPQTVKSEQSGSKLIIHNPDDLTRWLEGESAGRAAWWRRLIHR